MASFCSIISLLLLSLSSAVISDDALFQKLPVPGSRSGPEAFAFDSTGKGFYTGVSGGKILKWLPETGYVNFAQITESSNSSWCDGNIGTALAGRCGRPAGIAFNENTGDLYVGDAPLGLHVISPNGGLATKIADSVDGKPFKFLDGLDVDPTTGVVYFTSFSSRFSPIQVLIALGLKDATGKLYKYDPSTKVVTVLMEGLSGSAGCAVSSDGSFVLVSQFTKSNIKRYWIKGPKAGTSEDFTNSVSNPDNIKRVGSTGNFWVASVVNKFIVPTNPSAVKVNSDGEVLQTIPLKDKFGDTLLSEVNEFEGNLYIGTLTGPFAGILKLENKSEGSCPAT
ncbi:PREDICTED: protein STRICTOSIDINE SYNTHASE-LIKE 12 [Camelina sativa]|uniref:Protein STRICTOSIDINE SYNTHASE-LIKE 12 n=1 Tax=Camelina sativa TaxID=90675 RepID=A0ABM0WIC4_CAMSA|nr:PREDICTED: protein STRICTOSIDINE SYNTHASE-LIKE 12 [Camelina sativa]